MEAAGARETSGGRGAYMSGEFILSEGDVLKILVGQQGSGSSSAAGGGGGTFVATDSNTPLLVAGGGSGYTNGDYRNGSTSEGGQSEKAATVLVLLVMAVEPLEAVVGVPVVAVDSMEMEQATRAMEVNVVLGLSMVELEVHLATVVL